MCSRRRAALDENEGWFFQDDDALSPKPEAVVEEVVDDDAISPEDEALSPKMEPLGVPAPKRPRYGSRGCFTPGGKHYRGSTFDLDE